MKNMSRIIAPGLALLLILAAVSTWVACRSSSEHGGATTSGPPGEVPLPDAPDGRLGQAWRLPDLRDEARAD